MTVTQIELETKAIELSAAAFDKFCEDIAGMFGVDINCIPQKASIETVDSLKKRFKKLSAVNNVDTVGAMHGTFYLIFDQGGLFTLSGIIVMLPENRIFEEIKRGTIKDVNSMNDAVREMGNLCVGSWERIFRDEFEGHGHFLQNGTFIGNPWDKPEESIRLRKDDSLTFVPFEMTIGKYPAFKCGVIFPKSIFSPQPPAAAAETITVEEKVENKQAEQNSISDQNSDIQKENTVSETIKRITQSPAVLPGQPGLISLSVCAGEIMDKNVTWCSPDISVQQAVQKMQLNDTGYLMIGSEGVPEGIVSRSDITGAISPYLRTIFAKWRRPLDDATLNIRIKWIMSRPVRTIKPETPVIKVIENMRQLGVRCLPVVNQNGNVDGLVTVFDIFKVLSNNTDISYAGKTLQVPFLI